jgi:hypothetical protein
VIPPPYAPRSNRRFANFFFGTFFFLAKKKVHRSPFIKGKSFRKIPFAHKEKLDRPPFQREFSGKAPSALSVTASRATSPDKQEFEHIKTKIFFCAQGTAFTFLRSIFVYYGSFE